MRRYFWPLYWLSLLLIYAVIILYGQSIWNFFTSGFEAYPWQYRRLTINVERNPNKYGPLAEEFLSDGYLSKGEWLVIEKLIGEEDEIERQEWKNEAIESYKDK